MQRTALLKRSTRRRSGAPRAAFPPIPIRAAPTRALRPQRKAGCSCGGGCPACKSLSLAPAHDPAEREADLVADQVMRMPEPVVGHDVPIVSAETGAAPVQRQEDEEEELLQTKEAPGAAPALTASAQSAISGLRGGGTPLPAAERAFFEPRFGQDFFNVRIHDGPKADAAAKSINARAFTLGNHIAFATGEHRPGSFESRRLMAHELTHVVQQQTKDSGQLRRSVAGNSNCAANTDSAPADPIARLTRIDARAQLIALGAHHLLNVVSADETVFPDVTRAYRRRFGDPPAAGTKFRNRFTRARFDTREEALRSEMGSAANLFRTIHNRLARDIRYRCTGTRRATVENCRHRCRATDVAAACAGSSLRQIAICPHFWGGGFSDDQLAGALIHEIVHGRLNRPGHPELVRRRHRNPECFTSFVAENYGFAPFDVRCPRIF